MKKMSRKVMALALALVMTSAPVTASAAWDRLEKDDSTTSSSASSGSNKSTVYTFSSFQAKIAEYKAANSDVIGWLKVPGTNISTPILHRPSAGNNNYYVHRDWKGVNYPNTTYQNYTDTATYLDYRAVLGDTWRSGTSKNLVLYGHNWNNLRAPFAIGNKQGYTMFAQLPSYTDVNFAKENPHIYFSTGENEGIWRVFSVSYCELSNSFFYNNPNPSSSNGDFDALLKEWRTRSVLNFDVEVDSTDRLLTLSTCTRQYSAGEYQRFVVVARLLRDGESDSNTVGVTVNPNPKQPVFAARS